LNIYDFTISLLLSVQTKVRHGQKRDLCNNLVMSRGMPNIKKEWNSIFQNVDKKILKLSENDIVSEIKAYRKTKHKKTKDNL